LANEELNIDYLPKSDSSILRLLHLILIFIISNLVSL